MTSGVYPMWQRLTRLKTLDTQTLHYSEWSRKLGSFDLLGFTFCTGLPLGIFVTLPYCARTISGPSTLLSVILAFVTAIITGIHFVEMTMRLPKSGSIYTYTYSTLGEFLAFIIGWIAIFDYAVCAAYVVKAWSQHLNYVFNKNPHEFINPYVHHLGNDTVWDEKFDALALLGLLSAAAIVSCSVKVAGTVCMVFATVCSLVIASSILVGFFYTNATNWIKHGYFVNSLPGVFASSAYMLRSFSGVEAVTCLTEEIGNYHSRFPFVIPLSNCLLFLFHFLMCAIMTLIVPYGQLPTEIALPNLFGLISVPASRYILSVGSVCGFSGSVVAILIPPSRILQNMAADGLVFKIFAKLTNRGVPLFGHSVILLLIVSCLFLHNEILQEFLLISLPIRCLTCTFVTLLQRYRDTPAGLLAEVAHYKNMKKLRSLTSFLSNGSILTVPQSDSVVDDDSSITSSLIVRNIAVAQWDSDTLDSSINDNKSSIITDNHHPHHQTNNVGGKETSSLLSPTLSHDTSSTMVRSASKYGVPKKATSRMSIDKSLTESMHTITLDESRSLQLPHDCLRSPCTPVSDDPCFHLYQRDVPELPYAEKFDMYSPSNSAVNQTIIYGKAKFVLISCVIFLMLFSLIVTKCWTYLSAGYWWTIIVIIVCVFISTMCIGYLGWLPKNVDSNVGHQVPASPYLSILNCLLLCFMLASVSFSSVAKLLIVLSPGVVLYFAYGFNHSAENVRTIVNVSVTNEDFHESNQMINGGVGIEERSVSFPTLPPGSPGQCNGTYQNSTTNSKNE